MPEVLQAREGYELWHPNREKAGSKTTKAIVAIVLLISAALLIIITLGGWERLQSSTVAIMTLGWALLYVLFAFLVLRWNRGVLPVTAALAVLMIIFAAVAADGWFARDKPGLESPALPEDLLGILTIIVIPVQFLLMIVSAIAFNQSWNVEEERPIGRGPTPGSRQPYGGPGEPLATPPPTEPGTTATYLGDDTDDWADDGPQPNPAV